MSKARLVITAVITEGRSQGEVARAYKVSQGWVSRLVARYRAEGEAAFEPRSRRPNSSPRAIPDATVGLIIKLRKDLAGQGLDAGPQTTAWHLRHHHQIHVSAATISRYALVLGHGCVAGRLVHGLVVMTGLALPEEHHGGEPGRPLKNDYYLGRGGQGDEANSRVEGQETKENGGQDPCP